MRRIVFILSIIWISVVAAPGAALAASGGAPKAHNCAMASCTHDCCADGCTCCKDGKCDMTNCDKACEKKCEKKGDKGCGKKATAEKK
jgi:hypothetical protein